MPEEYLITDKTVERLRTIYNRNNDDMTGWAIEIAALRQAGLEPIPSTKHFYELAAAIKYLCGLVVSETATNAKSPSPYAVCVSGLFLEPTTKAITAKTAQVAPSTPKKK